MSDRFTTKSKTTTEEHNEQQSSIKYHAVQTPTTYAHPRHHNEHNTPSSVGCLIQTSAQQEEEDWKPKHSNRLVDPNPSQFLQPKKRPITAKRAQFTDPPEFLEHKPINSEAKPVPRLSPSRFILSDEPTGKVETAQKRLNLQEKSERDQD
ncbi:hypothetical protein FGADI_2625 [Fusarium gaditjirri]|uniref:Uncharacterized protein n=1 Tax=Fusarium gaditjirri TaxID=282569 RepID=A0A8H4X111_9HYPO|nr:hypothetical protein FGADI_2625 [Fusarium gaditjirri]